MYVLCIRKNNNICTVDNNLCKYKREKQQQRIFIYAQTPFFLLLLN